jgi:Flp pilus assembly protein TadD
MALLFSGRAAEAVAPLNRGLQLSPFDPQNFVWFNLLGLAHLFAGDAERALQSALRALKVRPDWRPCLETTVCCYVALGQNDKAGRLVAEMGELAISPGDALAPFREGNPHWAAQMRTMLRAAGFND